MLLFGVLAPAAAQVSIRDSSINMVMISPSYGAQVPGGDLAKRFGWNSAVGLSVTVKRKSGWYMQVEGDYIFGSKLKQTGMFEQITTEQGFIIGSGGYYADARLGERGYYITASVGKLFHKLGPNPNCGFFAQGGVGFLQHKIFVQDKKGTAPSIHGDYVKGYDRLTNGLELREMAGYMYCGNNRVVNFFGAVECVQGFTEGRRSYNFNVKKSDAGKRLDLLFGFRIGWIIPLFKEAPEKFYYY